MTESVKVNNEDVISEARLLIDLIPIVFDLIVTDNNLVNVLFLVYGLNNKEAKILIETSKGKIVKKSSYVVRKAKAELFKFLKTFEEIVIVEIFFELRMYEFRTT